MGLERHSKKGNQLQTSYGIHSIQDLLTDLDASKEHDKVVVSFAVYNTSSRFSGSSL